eukprot:2552907-Pleurochrysis_carterae.AAC.1
MVDGVPSLDALYVIPDELIMPLILERLGKRSTHRVVHARARALKQARRYRSKYTRYKQARRYTSARLAPMLASCA